MPGPLVPAALAFTPGGTPYSQSFDDVYHSSEGGPAQARHVFLGGNALPERWRARPRFVILETGFGLGLNFLATWAAWKEDPQRPAKLHYVSIEKHPFSVADLAQLHARYPEFGPQAVALRSQWPMLVAGMHRLEFDAGNVVLTVYFADIETAVPQLRLCADALFLDGFAPAKNPGMWSPRAMKGLARLCANAATFSTYTAAGSVRDALAAAGFSVDKRPGFAQKRDMLCGRLEHPRRMPAEPVRRAIVIGAGLAGSTVCERLSVRGWEVILVERHDAPAREASGNHAGAFHPLVTRDDSFMARLSRASFLHALRRWRSLATLEWSQCGVLQMPRSDDEDAAQRTAMASLAFPPEYARYVTREEAARESGTELAAGGLWFPHGGWMRPASLVRALLDKAGARTSFGTEVARLEQSDSVWIARDSSGNAIAQAPVVVLANAHDASRLAPHANVELRRVRGQVSYLPAAQLPAIGAVLLRGGMLIPPVGGIAVSGASYDIDDPDPDPRADSHAGNLERLARILPGAQAPFDPHALQGRVGFRAVTPDRLPMVGPVPGMEGVHGAFAYASRGILWCSLMAELLASSLEGEPLPIESCLADAVDPRRYLRRANRPA
jgi:tRNA 5-methylaminomethyl-2-thiouridine biosynthesis bifunctional protein